MVSIVSLPFWPWRNYLNLNLQFQLFNLSWSFFLNTLHNFFCNFVWNDRISRTNLKTPCFPGISEHGLIFHFSFSSALRCVVLFWNVVLSQDSAFSTMKLIKIDVLLSLSKVVKFQFFYYCIFFSFFSFYNVNLVSFFLSWGYPN